ncbi:MAG: right-handed parallel beta-helix repeat-containing protein [Planctomycetota bacterium]
MKRFEKHLIVVAGLIAFAGMAVVCQPSSTSSSAPPPPPQVDPPDPPEPPARPDGAPVRLVEFLPQGYVTDASVDYSVAVRTAIAEAAGGTLVLPSFPVLVSAPEGDDTCLRIVASMTIEGTGGAALVERAGGVQVVRAEEVDRVTLRGFHVIGNGFGGQGLAHGLVQVWRGRNVTLDGLTVSSADADGIALARVEDAIVTNCRVDRASKAGIYVNQSERVVVRGNHVTRFGGHQTSGGVLVGVGIQLSSNRDLVCASNVVAEGTGIGILCNALVGGATPVGNVVTGNRITELANPGLMSSSAGIRLANGAPEKFTQTVVRGNSIRDCGSFGIYLENHDGALVSGNSIAESERNGILVSTIRDAVVKDNVVWNSGTSGVTNLYAIQLINDATRVRIRDNTMGHLSEAKAANAFTAVYDGSRTRGNEILGRRTVGAGPPTSGRWLRGEVVLNSELGPTGPLGWVCASSGRPGVWRAFGE